VLGLYSHFSKTNYT